jgi:hypothetical protein
MRVLDAESVTLLQNLFVVEFPIQNESVEKLLHERYEQVETIGAVWLFVQLENGTNSRTTLGA